MYPYVSYVFFSENIRCVDGRVSCGHQQGEVSAPPCFVDFRSFSSVQPVQSRGAEWKEVIRVKLRKASASSRDMDYSDHRRYSCMLQVDWKILDSEIGMYT